MIAELPCPLCGAASDHHTYDRHHMTLVTCPRCGEFGAANRAIQMLSAAPAGWVAGVQEMIRAAPADKLLEITPSSESGGPSLLSAGLVDRS